MENSLIEKTEIGEFSDYTDSSNIKLEDPSMSGEGKSATTPLPRAEDYYYENMEVPKNDKQRYQCKMCSKTSNHRGHLKEHVMDIHFPDAKTECKYCGRLFKSGSLIRHHVAKCKQSIIIASNTG